VDPLLKALRDRANADQRVVRLQIEAFSPEPGGIDRIDAAARSLGFVKEPWPREYARTLLVDLRGGHDAMVGRFHRMVMKNVRRSERAGHLVAPIIEDRYAARMSALLDETMSRTGARAQRVDWLGMIRAARETPASHRIAGLFLGGDPSPDALAAFRWCSCSGASAEDLLAASTRLTGPSGSVPMMPAIVLDILTWAGAQGASWFDFGGIVEPTDPRYSTLGSITEFKMLFGADVRTVGADFTYESRPTLSRISKRISSFGDHFAHK
jgi:hypothetical protein